MNPTTKRPLRTTLLAATLLFGAATAFAGDDHDHGEAHGSPAAATTTTTDLSEGEVVRWDAASAKVTLRHGPIRNLDMPPMTMVFRVTDPAQAAQVKPGAKVRFRAEQQAGAYVVTRIELAAN